MNDEAKKETTHGLITGRGNGDWGRITVRTDGSILLENVALSNIAIRNCDLHAGSGERPIPFADRMNQLEDWATITAVPGHQAVGLGTLICVPTRLRATTVRAPQFKMRCKYQEKKCLIGSTAT